MTIHLINNSGICFDSMTTDSAKAAINFCKGRGGSYDAKFYVGNPHFSAPVIEVEVDNYGGRNTFSVVDFKNETTRRISAAALIEKLAGMNA